MTVEFDSPAPRLKITEFENELILIDALEIMHDVPAQFSGPSGVTDVTVVNLVCLNQDGRGEEHEGLWIFQKGLQGALRPRVGTGKLTLTRLVRAPSTKGDFQWSFANPSDADKEIARRYVADRQAAHSSRSQSSADLREFDRQPPRETRGDYGRAQVPPNDRPPF